MDEIYNDIQQAIDYAFIDKKYLLDSFKYLKCKNVKRLHAQTILRSALTRELQSYVVELNRYVKGSKDPETEYATEAYGFLSKPEARKLATYFDNIVEGIKKYINDKKGALKKSKRPTK
jgi:hypothetical protein